MIAGLRFITGIVANVNSAEELASRDNFAFGIAMAAGVISLALMLTGAVSGEPGETYLGEIVSVISYGILGLILIKVGRLSQDKFILTGIEIQGEIKAGNLAAALVDAANTIATGLVLRAVMLWVESDTLNGLLVVLAAFLLTQLLLALVTKYRLIVYARRSTGGDLQTAFKEGNVALAIRFMGHLLGVALAITAASGVVGYDVENLILALILWTGISLLFAVLVSLLAIIARNVVLMGVDVVEEVNSQNNVGVAAIEASIYISIGLFFTALFA
jgi:uncharacterized membrane protein YjfL (UPF0719 family)